MTGVELLLTQLRLQLAMYEKLSETLPSQHLNGVIEGIKQAIELAENARDWEKEKKS